jgi:glycosyltransferase involved in cell wall biosynthesis
LSPRQLREHGGELRHIPTLQVGRLKGQAWEQFELPFYSRHAVLVNLCNTAPLGRRGIVMLHDASVFVVPEAYSKPFLTWYRTLIPLLGRRALRVATVSRFSQGELARHAGIPAERIDVIPLGAEHILRAPGDESILARIGVERGRFILAVGSRSPHKNVGAVSAALARLGSQGLPLVQAGGANSRIFARSAALNGAIHVGYVSDPELRALYENAACFVFPSLYEGFGIPALEALACGCPAAVARSGSLPEVCGDAVLYFDPHDPDDIARTIRLALESRQADELRARGRERAARFTWEQASRALVALIDEVASR